MDNPRTLVVIPALNEADSIAKVVATIRQQIAWADVAVINDGSTDLTGEIAAAAGATVLHHPYNVGIGASVAGPASCLRLRTATRSCSAAMATASTTPHDLCRLIETLQATDADMVVGTRFIEKQGYGATLPRRVGILILARLISVITGQPVTDPTLGPGRV